jgi:hypothetical protein
MKIIVLLIGILLAINIAYALDCQYTEPVYEEKTVFYEDGNKLDYPVIEIKDFQPGSSNPFRVYNNHDSKRFGVEVEFTQRDGGRNTQTFELDRKESRPASIQNQFDLVDQNTITFRIVNDTSITFQKEPVEIGRICQSCNGNICSNDGIACQRAQECGGSYCVEGYCSNSEICFNNNCNCPQDKIQCNDNKRCVPTGVVPNDIKPECGKYQECVSRYINTSDGLCEKSPTERAAEEGARVEAEEKRLSDESAQKVRDNRKKWLMILGVAFLFSLGVVIAWYLIQRVKIRIIKAGIERTKAEIDRMRAETTQTKAEIEYIKNTGKNIQEKIENGKREMNILKRRIKEAEGKTKQLSMLEEQLRQKEETQKDRIRTLKIDEEELERETQMLNEQIKELDKKHIELDEKYYRQLKQRYPNAILNEEGYPVFGNNPKNLIHRYFYANKYKELYGKPFDETKKVHHIDVNRLNSLNMWNLIDITKEQHDKIHHARIDRGDWEKGIKVLLDALGWNESDLPRHIREERLRRIHFKKKKKRETIYCVELI